MESTINFELTREFLERFEEALDNQEVDFIKTSLQEANPADISALLEEFSAEQCKYVFDLLDPELDARILIDLDEDVRHDFIKIFTPKELSVFIENLDSDDGTDILYQLPLLEREKVIAAIEDEQKASHILELLKYDENVAGGLMAKELIKVKENWNVLQCIDEIRKQAENIEKIYSVYVVDEENNFKGKVSLKKIIISNDKTEIREIYDDEIISIGSFMEGRQVASIMSKYDLEAIPVINARGKLVGRITIDDIVEFIQEIAEEERQIMSGISDDVEENDSIWLLSKARLPWLIIGLAGGLLGAEFIGLFESSIALVPAMAFFIPLITATGGNVGIQSSSLIVQSLANPQAFEYHLSKRLLKVLLVALLNGFVLAIIVYSVVLLADSSFSLAYTVSAALFSVVLLASIMGTITPLILDKFGINPALASGPFITTANDLLGLAVYFMIADYLYGF
ncbi:MAG TPA: magnesium transporter [Cyclobacteriaceae bacterium]